MGKPKGLPKSGGRKKGTPNKTTALLKDAILTAAQEAGGGTEDGMMLYLRVRAADNPTAFMSLLGKVLPMQVTGIDGGAIATKIEIEFVEPKGSSSSQA